MASSYKQILLTGDAAVPSNNTPTAVDTAAAGAGTGIACSRDDHKHNASTGTPGDIGTANAAGSSTSVPHLDHTHNHPAIATGDLHTQYLLAAGTRALTANMSLALFSLTNQVIEPLASAPGVVTNGRVFYNTTDNHLYVGTP